MENKKINTNKIPVYAGVVIFLVVGTIFYWYEYRPNQIRKECAETSPTTQSVLVKSDETLFGVSGLLDYYKQEPTDIYYKTCLRRNGLKE